MRRAANACFVRMVLVEERRATEAFMVFVQGKEGR